MAVLAIVQARMRTHVRADLVSTLRAQSAVYTLVEAARREQAHQSAVLIADQPSLKALMSTNDRLTVEDGSESILRTSHADLLVLENASGEVLAFHAKSDDVPASRARQLMQASTGEEDWWFAGGHLYHVSFAPIVAGANANQLALGRIALGRELSPQSTRREPSQFVFRKLRIRVCDISPLFHWACWYSTPHVRVMMLPLAQDCPWSRSEAI